MKLQILSDTHNSKYSLSDEADVIIHAGDFSNRLSGAIEFAEKWALLHKPICKGFFSDIIFK